MSKPTTLDLETFFYFERLPTRRERSWAYKRRLAREADQFAAFAQKAFKVLKRLPFYLLMGYLGILMGAWYLGNKKAPKS